MHWAKGNFLSRRRMCKLEIDWQKANAGWLGFCWIIRVSEGHSGGTESLDWPHLAAWLCSHESEPPRALVKCFYILHFKYYAFLLALLGLWSIWGKHGSVCTHWTHRSRQAGACWHLWVCRHFTKCKQTDFKFSVVEAFELHTVF